MKNKIFAQPKEEILNQPGISQNLKERLKKYNEEFDSKKKLSQLEPDEIDARVIFQISVF